MSDSDLMCQVKIDPRHPLFLGSQAVIAISILDDSPDRVIDMLIRGDPLFRSTRKILDIQLTSIEIRHTQCINFLVPNDSPLSLITDTCWGVKLASDSRLIPVRSCTTIVS